MRTLGAQILTSGEEGERSMSPWLQLLTTYPPAPNRELQGPWGEEEDRWLAEFGIWSTGVRIPTLPLSVTDLEQVAL